MASPYMSANEKFAKSVRTLHEYVEAPILESRDIAGILFGFSATFELGWRAVQDDIAAKGYSQRGPRPSLQAGLEAGLIPVDDAEVWAEMVESRNLVARAYRPEWAIALVEKIRSQFLPALEQLKQKLSDQAGDAVDSVVT